MPTYEYACNACGHQFEVFQSIKDGPKRKCPECGKLRLERLISGGGAVIFKGSGFYQTDYRSESYKKAAEADAKPASDAKGDKKSEPKKDKKADTPKTDKKPKPSAST